MSIRGAAKFLFPDSLKHEIQTLIAVNCREIVYQGRDCKEEAQFEKMKKAFHGTEDHTSLLKTFMAGKAPYNHCFEELEQENNREGNDERQGEKLLKLKSLFHCMEGSEFVVHERGFAVDAIASSRGNTLTGRALNDKCRHCSANYKIAYKFYKEFCPQDKLPSGKSLEDMLLYVRQKMFTHFKGAKDQDGCNRLIKKALAEHKEAVQKVKEEGTAEPVPKEVDVEDDDMPSDCLFTGFFAFVLFGPMGLAKVSLSIFAVDGNGGSKKSRKEPRKEEKLAKDFEREKTYVPDDYNRRGVSLSNLSTAAQLEQRDIMDRQKAVNDRLFVESMNHQNLLRELKTVNDMLDAAKKKEDSPNKNEIAHLENWQGGIFDKLEKNRKRKFDLDEEADRLSEERSQLNRQNAVKTYLDRIGIQPRSDLFETPRQEMEDRTNDTNINVGDTN